ncbi:cora-domain-containing protein [Rhizodiscina lignyota]|uniref:Cora-domain-containing protein n=1 Tax=Rhizodiscina lignyota TaxID=1504668 RepID=A0A9P4IA20_9PEZI|nr:cora-domain-containing protein [Rhizodiscina lignyota]
MGDSPRSELFEEGLSPTAIVDLDDHRFQPSSMPRTNTMESHNRSPMRRGTIGSNAERPDLLYSASETQAIQWNGITVRDFPEHAIADDGKSVMSQKSTSEGRRGSVVGRRSTFRRAPEHVASGPSKSRTSSMSSRSISPPNSVEAFAESRRRDRSGTLRSQVPSDTDLPLYRTQSGGTHRRRPTFSDNRSVTRSVASSRHSSAEEDVCYPQEEEQGKAGPIDFEELDEFVAEQRAEAEASRLLRSPVMNGAPKILTTAPSPDARPIEVDLDEEKQEEEQSEETPQAQEETNTISAPNEPPLAKPFWAFFSSDMDDTVYSPTFHGLLADGETSRDLFQRSVEGGVWWLDMLNPSEEEVTVMCKAFGIHPLTREDITTQETREKVELFRTYYFVCFRSFYQTDKHDENYLEPVNVYVVVFREGLLTFTYNANPHAMNVRKRIGRLRDYMQLSSDWICYALIDDIVDSFAPVIHDIELQTESIEDDVFTARAADSRAILRAIGESRKRVMSLLRLLGGKADVIKGFAKRCNENYSIAPHGDVGMYLSDIQDHVVTMIGNLSHFEKMLSRSHSNYLAQIQVDSISQGNKVQDTLGKVTLVATILVPLNLVTGLFGMNVNVPGGGVDGLGWWFGILGMIAFFVICCMCIARRKKLI